MKKLVIPLIAILSLASVALSQTGFFNNKFKQQVNGSTADDLVRYAQTIAKIAYACIYVADNVTAQSIPLGATYTKLTHFASNGESLNCTADAANDKITITQAGKYYVCGNFSFSGDATATTFWIALFYDGAEVSRIHIERKLSAGGDVGAASFSGIVSAAANKDIDVRARHDNGGGAENIVVHYSNLMVMYLGD